MRKIDPVRGAILLAQLRVELYAMVQRFDEPELEQLSELLAEILEGIDPDRLETAGRT